MKVRNIILPLAVCLAAFGSQSCLKNQVDYFNQTASSRMQAALDNARKVLYSAENGWQMEYFTEMGGYNFAVKFIDEDFAGNPVDSVVATSELSPAKMAGSYFRLTTDDGPVLSFDTYNEVLHYFSTPDWNNYQARGGDFEFIILSATPDEVLLKGKRSGRFTRMVPIEAPATLTSFVEKMAAAANDFLVVSATGVSDGTPVKMDLDLTNRSVVMTAKNDDGEWDELNAVAAPYLITTGGIKFENALEFAGHEISYFTFNKNTRRLLADDEDLSLKAADIPSDYTYFKDYPGEYTFSYGDGTSTVTADVTVEVYDELSRIVEVKGFVTDYDGFLLWYNASTGRLQFLPQYVGVLDDEFQIAAFTIDSKGNVSSSAPFDLVPNPTPDKGFKFVSTPGQKFAAIGYALFRKFENEDGDTDYEPFKNWNPYMVYPKTLTRK